MSSFSLYSKFSNVIQRFLYNRMLFIGMYEPLILYAGISYELWSEDNHTLLNYYLIGITLNTILNILLKNIFKQPRPDYNVNKDLAWYNVYGMPSGHTQSVGFSAVYMFYSLQQTYREMVWYVLLISIVTWQRVHEHYHTIIQTLVGLVIGCVFAHIVYKKARRDIVKSISPKPDDNSKALP